MHHTYISTNSLLRPLPDIWKSYACHEATGILQSAHLARDWRQKNTSYTNKPSVRKARGTRIETLVLCYWIIAQVATPARRGTTVTVRATLLAHGGELAEHRASVAVRGPDGDRLPGYPDLIVLRDGVADLRLPLALNAPLGRWQVTVTDAISNVSGTTTFAVSSE